MSSVLDIARPSEIIRRDRLELLEIYLNTGATGDWGEPDLRRVLTKQWTKPEASQSSPP